MIGLGGSPNPDANTMTPIVALLIAMVVMASPAAAQSGCAASIAKFRTEIERDMHVGDLNKPVYGRIVPQLDRISQQCRAGQDAQASSALDALKRRYGYH